VIELWRARAEQCAFETYAGLPCGKLPEDLRTYEHLLWLENVEVVVELGAYAGGSTLWFRDRLRTLASYGRIARPRVIAIDTEIGEARHWLGRVDPAYASEITLLEGDVTDEALAGRVKAMIDAGASCLVIEDTAHLYATTIAALRNYSGAVRPGGFFVVEDGGVDIEELRIDPSWPRGVLPAIHDWLSSEQGAGFAQRRDLELYGLGCGPEGILQRKPDQ
jgi:cephalosporin hydroxylase